MLQQALAISQLGCWLNSSLHPDPIYIRSSAFWLQCCCMHFSSSAVPLHFVQRRPQFWSSIATAAVCQRCKAHVTVLCLQCHSELAVNCRKLQQALAIAQLGCWLNSSLHPGPSQSNFRSNLKWSITCHSITCCELLQVSAILLYSRVFLSQCHITSNLLLHFSTQEYKLHFDSAIDSRSNKNAKVPYKYLPFAWQVFVIMLARGKCLNKYKYLNGQRWDVQAIKGARHSLG